MKKYLIFILVFFIIPVNGQGIINSSGYIAGTGAPYITVLNGSLNNNGTWTKSSETIHFTGTTAADLKGLASGYHNIVVSNSAGITLNTSNTQTFDNLTINTGGIFTIIPTGKLTVSTALTCAQTTGLVIKSTVDGSGSLVHSSSGVSATVEQYHTDQVSGSIWYHTVSSPISNGTAAVFKFAGAAPYFYEYDPALTGSKWVNIVSSATSLVPGKGYLVNYNTNTVPLTCQYAGLMNVGNVSVSLKSGYNLIGNPYPCAMDWNYGQWNLPGGISSTYSVWVPTTGSYGTYVTNAGAGTNGVNQYIASGQGFFVNNTGSAPSLTIPAGSKTHSYNSILKSGNTIPLVKLKITNNINAFSDEAIVWFSLDGTNRFDKSLEGQKILSMNSASSQIYTRSRDSISLAINSMPLNSRDTIPLYFKCAVDGSYELAPTLSNIADSVILLDYVARKRIHLKDLSYAFSGLKTDTIKRFDLIFKSAQTSTQLISVSEKAGLSISASNDILMLNAEKPMHGELTITNILGQLLVKKRIQLEGSLEIPIQVKGIIIITFNNGTNVYSKKIVNP